MKRRLTVGGFKKFFETLLTKEDNTPRLVMALGIVGVMFLIGFEVGSRKYFPYKFIKSVENRTTGVFQNEPEEPTAPTEWRIPSHLLNLSVRLEKIQTGRDPENPYFENGGGMTSYGTDVLVLAYNSKIYASDLESPPRETKIEAPDNGRNEYRSLSEDSEFSEFDIHKGNLRYNDLEYFETRSKSGLIASYTEFHPNEVCYTNTIARVYFPISLMSIDEIEISQDDWEIIFRTKPCLPFKKRFLALEGHMAGGRIIFDPPSSLYLTSGDFHLDGMRANGPPIAQNFEAHYGKVIAIDIEDGSHQIISTGHRNPQGIALTSNGSMMVVEHGPRGGDELNHVELNRNFGWPLESYGIPYESLRIPGSLSFGRHDTFAPPIFAWVPSIGTSGMTISKNFHSSWENDVLVSSLADRSLHRIRMNEDQIAYSERIEIGYRIRDIHEHTDGSIVLWTVDEELIYLRAEDRSSSEESIDHYIRGSDLPDEVEHKLRTAIYRCLECHSIDLDEHSKAPSLARIYDARIAATQYKGYSQSLRDKEGYWTAANLHQFLTNPNEFVPGTAMPSQHIENEEVVSALVGYLTALENRY